MAKRLTVTGVNEIRSGAGPNGPWTLFEIEARDDEGNQIAEQLKSFSRLPLGVVEVEVERQEHERYGISYLLKPVNSGGGGGGAAAGDLGALRARIERLESQVAQLMSGSPPAPGPQAASPPGLPDDDIPF